MKENRAINRYTNTTTSGNIIWGFKGFGALFEGKDNEIHVSKKDLVKHISNLHLFMGKAQKVTTQALFEYIGKDDKIFQQIMVDYPYNIRTHEIKEGIEIPEIYVNMPLENGENKMFLSKIGNFMIDADRFKQIITAIYEMRKSIKAQKIEMGITTRDTLDFAVDISGKSAVIGGRVSELEQANVTSGRSYQPQYEQPQEQRRSM